MQVLSKNITNAWQSLTRRKKSSLSDVLAKRAVAAGRVAVENLPSIWWGMDLCADSLRNASSMVTQALTATATGVAFLSAASMPSAFVALTDACRNKSKSLASRGVQFLTSVVGISYASGAVLTGLRETSGDVALGPIAARCFEVATSIWRISVALEGIALLQAISGLRALNRKKFNSRRYRGLLKMAGAEGEWTRNGKVLKVRKYTIDLGLGFAARAAGVGVSLVTGQAATALIAASVACYAAKLFCQSV